MAWFVSSMYTFVADLDRIAAIAAREAATPAMRKPAAGRREAMEERIRTENGMGLAMEEMGPRKRRKGLWRWRRMEMGRMKSTT